MLHLITCICCFVHSFMEALHEDNIYILYMNMILFISSFFPCSRNRLISVRICSSCIFKLNVHVSCVPYVWSAWHILVFYYLFERLPYASCCFSEPVWVITSPCNIRTLGWWKRHGSSEAWFHTAWGQCPIEERPWNREMGVGVSLGFDSTTFWVLTSRNSAGTKLG